MKLSSVEKLQLLLFRDNLRNLLNKNKEAWGIIVSELELPSLIHRLPSADSLVTALLLKNLCVDHIIEKLKANNLHEVASYLCTPEDVQITEPYLDDKGEADCSYDEDGSVVVKAGGVLHLSISASGNPMPTAFHWYRDNTHLSSEQALTVRYFRKEYEGEYGCEVHQLQAPRWILRKSSKRLTVKISGEEERVQLKPTEKRALIFANETYSISKLCLHAPVKDAAKLKNLLQNQYDFSCEQGLNLNGSGMKLALNEFCTGNSSKEGLKEGALVLFYFAGHGFSNGNTLRMLGCDATNLEGGNEAYGLSEIEVLNEILRSGPSMCICIFDTCLIHTEQCLEPKQSNQLLSKAGVQGAHKARDSSETSRNYFGPPRNKILDTKVKNNLIRWYSASQNTLAFEDDLSQQSVFMHHFLRVFEKDENKDSVFQELARDVNKGVQKTIFEKARKNQSPGLYTETEIEFSLSVPIIA